MSQSTITVIVKNNAYTLSTTDLASLRDIPDADRRQLIALLEVLKQQESALQTPSQETTSEANNTAGYSTTVTPPRPERLGSGDVDNIMAQLIMEERANQKPGLTVQTIYLWAAVAAIVIILLFALF